MTEFHAARNFTVSRLLNLAANGHQHSAPPGYQCAWPAENKNSPVVDVPRPGDFNEDKMHDKASAHRHPAQVYPENGHGFPAHQQSYPVQASMPIMDNQAASISRVQNWHAQKHVTENDNWNPGLSACVYKRNGDQEKTKVKDDIVEEEDNEKHETRKLSTNSESTVGQWSSGGNGKSQGTLKSRLWEKIFFLDWDVF